MIPPLWGVSTDAANAKDDEGGERGVDISGDIARYSMDRAAARVSTAVQVSMLKNVMELQETTMAQLLQSLGIGRGLDLQA